MPTHRTSPPPSGPLGARRTIGPGLYVLLSLALAGMVLLSLLVNTGIERALLQSISTNEFWAAKFGQVSTLGGLTSAMQAPGTAVFLDRHVAEEREQMVALDESLFVRIVEMRRTLPQGLFAHDSTLMLVDLDRVRATAESLRVREESVFASVQRGRIEEATRHLAWMDAWYSASLRGIRTLRADLGAAQDSVLRSQRASAVARSHLLRLAGILMIVLAAGGGWLGFRLSREAERHAAERDHTTELIAKAQAELEEAHARLTAAHKELESFSYSVAHDLRAPLRRILGFSQALEEDNLAQLDAGGRDHVARIREASVRMGSLIDDLLGLARVTRQDLKRVQVDVTALATELVEELRGQEPGRRVAVEIEPGMQVYADQALTRVLLQNLLGNAWKFTRNVPEARITVAWERKDRWSPDLFMVRDNGAGFEMAYAGKLFGAFQRMHTLAEFEGTGVGLATVRRIVERHGGTVRAEAAVGAGATFRFTLGR